jgi:outer membrane protein
MKKMHYLALVMILASGCLCADDSSKPLKIRVVNFKTCVEQSKLGLQEQASFEALKKQMESVLGEKEKMLKDISGKFEDADYVDSLSPEAETEMKRKCRALGQELTQLQNQYLQTLQQTNFTVVQKLTETVSQAAQTVAKQENIDLVINAESAFFVNGDLDISQKVIRLMDENQKSSENKKSDQESILAPVAVPSTAR